MILDWKGVAVLGAVGALAAYALRKQAAVAAEQAATALNPVSSQNIFYRGSSGLVNVLSNDAQELPLGVRLYDWIHSTDAAP